MSQFCSYFLTYVDDYCTARPSRLYYVDVASNQVRFIIVNNYVYLITTKLAKYRVVQSGPFLNVYTYDGTKTRSIDIQQPTLSGVRLTFEVITLKYSLHWSSKTISHSKQQFTVHALLLLYMFSNVQIISLQHVKMFTTLSGVQQILKQLHQTQPNILPLRCRLVVLSFQ